LVAQSGADDRTAHQIPGSIGDGIPVREDGFRGKDCDCRLGGMCDQSVAKGGNCYL
jgi:hypothetical protein